MRVTTKVIAIEPTTVCTLRCKLCALGIPYLKSPKHEPIELLSQELSRLFKIWDYAERVDVGGGEPLCHPEIVDILEEILKYRDHYDSIRVVTNCTIMPDERLWNVLQKYRDIAGFLLDDYGQHSPKAKQIKKMCEERGIAYKYNVYYGNDQYCDGWIDFGGWEKRNLDKEELNTLFQMCHTSENPCITVYGGYAYFCCRSMLGELLGYYKVDEFEKINLVTPQCTLDEQRFYASRFGLKPVVGCQYCNGFSATNKRYPAAEQMDQ